MEDNLNEETQMQDSTTVEELDVNLDEIFGNVGAENVMLPNDSETEEEKKSNLFSKPEEVDTTFIDKTESKTEEQTIQEKINSTPDSVVEEALSELDDAITAEEAGDSKAGKSKKDKNSLIDLANKMIEEGTLFGFDDDKTELDMQYGNIICDPKSFLYLNGTEVDFEENLMGRGFKFDNPAASKTCGCGESFSV